MTFPDYGNCDGLGLAELVRKKTVSPSELVKAKPWFDKAPVGY
jgi:hypothetical protein